jgi:hypothetical protein
LKHCPELILTLMQEGRLEEALQVTEERTADLLYELLSVRKVSYIVAWDLAMLEWILQGIEALPQASSCPNPNPNQLFSLRETSD